MTDADTVARATELLGLHRDPKLLTVVNVWDVVSARTVAAVPGTTALATARHSIAASYGYQDGENIPLDLMIDAIGRIAAATELPVTADLEAGYGDPAETVRRAIGVGIVGANLEDQMKPLDEAAAAVSAVMAAAADEGVDFVLNARTDAFAMAGERDPADVLADAIGPQRLTVIGIPGGLSLEQFEELGVARVSYGPMPQRVALTALQELVEDIQRGGGIPRTMRQLN